MIAGLLPIYAHQTHNHWRLCPGHQCGFTGWQLHRDPYAKAVREQPGHIDQRELARTLSEQWGLAPGRLRHLPVGFGDHHWELTDAAGGRWFVTVAGLAGGAAGRYTELTGRPVSGAAMDLYRLRWSLDDIALAVRDFRASHEQNEDSALTWEALAEAMEEIE